MANGLPFFHALSDCDTTSHKVANYGKKYAWATWLAWPEITETFISLSKQTSPELPEDIMVKLERFIVLLYNRTSGDESVNSARLSLFCQMSRPTDNIPPIQSCAGGAYQAIYLSSGDIASKSVRMLRLHLTGDGRWMVPSSSQNGQCRGTLAEKICLELI